MPLANDKLELVVVGIRCGNPVNVPAIFVICKKKQEVSTALAKSVYLDVNVTQILYEIKEQK